MTDAEYMACMKREASWAELAKQLGWDNGERLRSAFRYERLKRGGGSTAQVQENSIYEQGDDFINIVCASKRMLTKEDVIDQFKIDMEVWEVHSFVVKSSEGYRKDRKVDWHVDRGVVTSGDVEDSGKMLVVPLFHITVRLRKKKVEIQSRSIFQSFVEEAKKYAPKYPKIKYAKITDKLLYEIDMPDIHLGRLAWGPETGEDYDLKIAVEMVHHVLDKLLAFARLFPIERVLLPLGSDLFNVNSMANTTLKGTVQQEDTRWEKTFQVGRQMAVGMIEKCAEIAPVDVIIIKGNHDAERVFYLGDVLDAWFNHNPNVNIDNTPRSRKYYAYGAVLLGFTHGSDEKLASVPALMPSEVPELWGRSKYREFHLGHKHSKYETNDFPGVTVRILRSLTAADAWTFDKGFTGSLRSAESFLWSHDNGLVAQFTAMPKTA